MIKLSETITPCRTLVTVAAFLVSSSMAWSQSTYPDYVSVSATNTRVPQNLLALVHAQEVQEEIGVTDTNRAAFEKGLREIDKIWWPVRIQGPEKQRQIVFELESKLSSMLGSLLGESGLKRLHEIEYQSQSTRFLARPELSGHLELSTEQQKKIYDLFDETDKLARETSTANSDPKTLEKLQQARTNENKVAFESLTIKQTQLVRSLIGKTIDTLKLQRIYPLAPELHSVKKLHGEGNVELSKLRGKVVLIHFYAFQCHNCHNNFKHYKRWSEELKSKGVEVIGIQTPETSAENDPSLVSAAAKKEAFQFPVIMDKERRNWDSWGNTMWPTVYVVDKNGYIRFWWQGELNWNGATGDKKIEEIVQQLLQES